MTDKPMTMVERVARAMWNARELTLPLRTRQPFKARLTDDIFIMALAAIEAMREPTEDMGEAGYAAACKYDYGDMSPGLEISPATWRAMIDAALAEHRVAPPTTTPCPHGVPDRTFCQVCFPYVRPDAPEARPINNSQKPSVE